MTREAEAESVAPLRIGIFGGTFDPPHVGHVSVVREVADRLDLDQVLWIPARRSPHKPDRPLTDDELRLEMTRAAAAEDPRFEVDDLELHRPPPSYTVETLRALRDRLGPDADLWLIVGLDQYRAFDAWHEPEEILSLARLAVMDRGGEGLPERDARAPNVRRVPVRRVDVSATEVRRRCAAGASISGLVPPGVERIVAREGLYGADASSRAGSGTGERSGA